MAYRSARTVPASSRNRPIGVAPWNIGRWGHRAVRDSLGAGEVWRSVNPTTACGKGSWVSETFAASAIGPDMVAEILFVRHSEVVAGAVRAVARGANLDHDELVDEVRSELAIAMLSGRFGGYEESRASFETYLSAAARNAAVSILRRSKRHPQPLGDKGNDAHPGPDDDATTPELAMLARERQQAVHAALDDLAKADPLATDILRARYLEGRAYPEIARCMGFLHPKAMYVRAYRGRVRLASMLKHWAG